MANINRMAILLTISEITPQLFLAGKYFSLSRTFFSTTKDGPAHFLLGQMAATIEQVQRLGITYIVVSDRKMDLSKKKENFTTFRRRSRM